MVDARRRGVRSRAAAYRDREALQAHPAPADEGLQALSGLRELESRVGEEVAVSPWVQITQERIDTFAKAIDDFQWIHVDRGRARHSPYGGTIAHGFLTLSLLSHLSERTFSFADRKMGVN